MFGEDEDWLYDISIEMDPKDGRLTVFGTADEEMTALTRFRVKKFHRVRQNLSSRLRPASALSAN